jgi:hypothetical protein
LTTLADQGYKKSQKQTTQCIQVNRFVHKPNRCLDLKVIAQNSTYALIQNGVSQKLLRQQTFPHKSFYINYLINSVNSSDDARRGQGWDIQTLRAFPIKPTLSEIGLTLPKPNSTADVISHLSLAHQQLNRKIIGTVDCILFQISTSNGFLLIEVDPAGPIPVPVPVV